MPFIKIIRNIRDVSDDDLHRIIIGHYGPELENQMIDLNQELVHTLFAIGKLYGYTNTMHKDASCQNLMTAV